MLSNPCPNQTRVKDVTLCARSFHPKGETKDYHVRVSDDSGAQDTVENRVDRSDGRRGDQGNESGRQQSFKRPVVASVRLVRRRERSRVVDGTLDI